MTRIIFTLASVLLISTWVSSPEETRKELQAIAIALPLIIIFVLSGKELL